MTYKLGKTEEDLKALSMEWLLASGEHRYSYRFKWMGVPIIQYPQDILAMQELIWKCQPDLIIETGIAHGGSLIFHASLLELIGKGEVLGVDIDIRDHNRKIIEAHPMFKRITMIEGSAIDDNIVDQVRNFSEGKKKIIVVLDSNHTHDHVLQELKLYSPLVNKDSYLVVFDTIVDDTPDDYFPDRPWGPGDNPKTAVHAFLKENDRFMIDKEIQERLLVTVAPDGYLKCIK